MPVNRNSLLAGAIAVALSALVYVQLHPRGALGGAPDAGSPWGPEAHLGHGVWGTAEPGSYRVPFTAFGGTALVLTLGMPGPPPERGVYVKGKVCALPIDGGKDPGPLAIPGLDITWTEPRGDLCNPDEPAVEFWAQGNPGAGWACACSSGADCDWTAPAGRGQAPVTGPAPIGKHLGAGTWNGAGCIRKPCRELSGSPTHPAGCPGF